MTFSHGITSAPAVRVKCGNEQCPRPADSTVTLPTIGPGVYGLPALRCMGCDQDLTIATGE